MDTSNQYHPILNRVLHYYAQTGSSEQDIRDDVLVDPVQNRYALASVGWGQGRRRVYLTCYARVAHGLVILDYDGLGHGIAHDLYRLGVPAQSIVLGWYAEHQVSLADLPQPWAQNSYNPVDEVDENEQMKGQPPMTPPEPADAPEHYRTALKKILLHYAQFPPSHGNMRTDAIFDVEHDIYALVDVGWEQGRRVSEPIFYGTIRDGKIVLEHDGLGHGITDDLLALGVPADAIVLAWKSEEATVTVADVRATHAHANGSLSYEYATRK